MSANRCETSMFTRFTSAVLAGLMAFLPFNGIRLGGEAKAEEPSIPHPGTPAVTPVVRVMPPYNAPLGREVTLWGNADNAAPKNCRFEPVPPQWESDYGIPVMPSGTSEFLQKTTPFPVTIYGRSSNQLFISQRGLVDLEPANTRRTEKPPFVLPGTHNGIRHWWSLDESLKDSVGQLEGTLIGDCAFEPGPKGHDLRVSRTGSYAEFPHSPVPNWRNASFTLDNWFRLDSWNSGIIPLTPYKRGGFGGMFIAPTSWGNYICAETWCTSSTGRFVYKTLDTSKFPRPGQWVHVTLVHDSVAATLTTYLNGVAVANGTGLQPIDDAGSYMG